ncbi:PREDICTED: protein grainyhead-like [Priapulus caudatus]|uniref:Protein grainyhead-like n=1 Tax=Priapulus caudatus TaxID=37621 RepID=A0ABM1EN82_PRICU|nr:PREDICTED: protein grainyhead-like [Priapulus caudatus]
MREPKPMHRGYNQIKVFCDKGAERKTRDEERRASKRKMASTSARKKIEDMYHPPMERSEFYSMSDLAKRPCLFSPSDSQRPGVVPVEVAYYQEPSSSLPAMVPSDVLQSGDDRSPMTDSCHTAYSSPDHGNNDKLEEVLTQSELLVPPAKKRRPNEDERVMLYVKEENDKVFSPLHVVPPNLMGLLQGIEERFRTPKEKIRDIFKRCKKDITVKMDDVMLRHYHNEDCFTVDITHLPADDMYDVTFIEL